MMTTRTQYSTPSPMPRGARCSTIQEIYERWTDTYSAYWAEGMSFIKRAAEAAARPKDSEEND